MADGYVLWTPFPLAEAEPEPSVALAGRVGVGDPRTGRRTMSMVRAVGHAHRAWARRRLRLPSRPVYCPLRVSWEWPAILHGQDVADALELAAALHVDAGLVLALTPPPVLLEHLWREAVWRGGTVPLDELAHDGQRRVQEAYDQLFEVTSAASRREVVTTCPGRAEHIPPSADPAWQISARGMEILRRMNVHAANRQERRWMRQFCLQTFPRSVEPEAAVHGEHGSDQSLRAATRPAGLH